MVAHETRLHSPPRQREVRGDRSRQRIPCPSSSNASSNGRAPPPAFEAGAAGQPRSFRPSCASGSERGGGSPKFGKASLPVSQVAGVVCPYEVLQVAQDASLQEVRHAYRLMALKTHPDKPGGDEQTFMAVQFAFDQILKLRSSSSGTCAQAYEKACASAGGSRGTAADQEVSRAAPLPTDPEELLARLSEMSQKESDAVLKGLPPARKRALLKHMEAAGASATARKKGVDATRRREQMVRERESNLMARFADSYGSAAVNAGSALSW